LLPDGVVVHSDGIVIFANSAAARIISAPGPGDLIGKPAIEFVHPDYREMAIDRIRQAFEENKPAPIMEEVFINHDGSRIMVEVASVPFRYGGKMSMLTVFNDITLRRQAEEKILMLAHAIRSIGEGVSITDMANNLLFVNRTFLNIYQYEEHELLGNSVGMVTSPNNPPEITQNILSATVDGGCRERFLTAGKTEVNFPYSFPRLSSVMKKTCRLH